jgi:hypothetical protein
MRNVLLVLFLVIEIGGSVLAGDGRDFVTVDPEPEGYAWWLRARFRPFETEVRGIPAQKIRKNWCKASEFRRELFPQELQNDLKLQRFAVDGSFDGSKNRQTALVGAYETCDGVTGSFFLVLSWPRQGPPTVRFIIGGPSDHQFHHVSVDTKQGISIWIWSCMDCDAATQYKWDQSKRTFIVVPEEF